MMTAMKTYTGRRTHRVLHSLLPASSRGTHLQLLCIPNIITRATLVHLCLPYFPISSLSSLCHSQNVSPLKFQQRRRTPKIAQTNIESPKTGKMKISWTSKVDMCTMIVIASGDAFKKLRGCTNFLLPEKHLRFCAKPGSSEGWGHSCKQSKSYFTRD